MNNNNMNNVNNTDLSTHHETGLTKLGFIGSGRMANAIIKGVVKSGNYKPHNILVSDVNQNSLTTTNIGFGVTPVSGNVELVQNSDIIILAVKPFVIKNVLKEIKPHLTHGKLIISIAAGTTLKSIENILGEAPAIRVMPNTPALVNEAMSVVSSGKYANDEHIDVAIKIFKSVGKVLKLDEKYFNIVTAINGSGPAFYYYIIDEIARAGAVLGLDYQTSLLLSAQTAFGSAKMIMETDIKPEELIINVTTPGGTTEAGNNTLIEHNISDILFDTIKATMEKAQSMEEN